MPGVEEKEFTVCRNCNSRVPKRKFCMICGKEMDGERALLDKVDTGKNAPEPLPQSVERENSVNMGKKICPSCKRQTSNKYSFCIYCGLKIDDIDPSDSISDEKTNFCSDCGRYYGKDLKFCLLCGKPLVSTPLIKKKPSTKAIPEFKGFAIPLISSMGAGFASKRDKEVLPATTSIMRLSPGENRSIFFSGTPIRSKNVKSPLFTVLISANLTKSDSLWRSLVINAKHYFLTWLFVYLIYVFWFFFFFDGNVIKNIFSLDIFSYIEVERLLAILLFAIPNSAFVAMILIIPVITLSQKVFFKHEITVIYRIEPAIMILTFFTNLIITALQLFIPLIMLPGDIKMKELPPEKEIGGGLSSGVTTCVILTSLLGVVVFSIIGIPPPSGIAESSILIETFQITYIMCSWICMITLLPIGNVLGKMIQKKDSKRFILLLSISVLLIIYSVTLSDVYR